MIEQKPQDTIAVYSKPILLGGQKTEYDISTFSAIIKQPFLEKIDGAADPSAVTENITGDLSASALKSQLKQLLQNGSENLAICHMNEQVGYGVFASSDIPKDRVVCFYSGEMHPELKVKEGNHAIAYYGADISFNTSKYRGIASFFQHLPSVPKIPVKLLSIVLRQMGQYVSKNDLMLNDELYAVNFESSAREALATENIRLEYIIYRNTPVILLVTNRAIKNGEQLGFNYGKDYWLCRKTIPEYFDVSGKIIPAESYKRTFYQLNLPQGQHYIGSLAPLIQQLSAHKKTVNLCSSEGQDLMIDAKIIADELLRVRAINADEHHRFTHIQTYSKPNTKLFPESKLAQIVKLYKLPDSAQKSLEKGLRMAAANNKAEDINIFIELGANINAQDTNPKIRRTALHWATIKGYQDCIDVLLSQGCDTDITDADNKTAHEYIQAETLLNTL